MSGSTFQTLFRLGYSISPIILVGGIARDVPENMLPIITITEGASLLTGILTGSFPSSLDDFFAQFTVLPSGNLIRQSIGHYPFANQAVASNAVIAEPLSISVRMDCPANTRGSYVSKLAVLTSLQAALAAHNASGGLYTIATPSFIYPNCIMSALTDISGSGSAQVQYQWQFDFEQPLVTLSAAQQVYSALINKITQGTQINGLPTWSSVFTSASTTIGGAASSLVSGASNLIGVNAGTPAPTIPVFQSSL